MMSELPNKKFLQRVPLARARQLAVDLSRPTETESVATDESLGRFTSRSVFARFASPHYRASAMDGIAVRAADTEAAAPDAALLLAEADATDSYAGEGVCAAVDTGNPLPQWADAVIRIEDTERSENGYRITAPVSPGRDVRRVGEDVEAGAALFGPGHRIRPFDIGAMLATGVEHVEVRRPPSVAVLATGSEIVEPGGTPRAGQVIEFNSRVLLGCVAEWGGRARYLGRVADERQALERAIRSATAQHDVVCVIAGSSAGRKDYTVDVLRGCGTVHFHGVDMMPGKPAALAEIGSRPVIGVPGYPVSAYAVYRELLAPLIASMLGTTPAPIMIASGIVKRRIVSRLGVEELLRVCLTRNAEGLTVAPLPRGAGSVTTLVRADGILRIAATSEGIDEGTRVDVELLETGSAAGSTWVVAGRPDALTTEIEATLRARGAPVRVAYLGRAAYDAAVALAVGEAHTALVSLAEADDAQTFRALLGQRAPELELLGDTDESGAGMLIATTPDTATLPWGKELVRLLRERA